MKCPQKIIVSIICNEDKYDLELPTDAKIAEIKKSIISTLNSYYKSIEETKTVNESIDLYYGANKLEEDKILGNYGIWDGSIIIVR